MFSCVLFRCTPEVFNEIQLAMKLRVKDDLLITRFKILL